MTQAWPWHRHARNHASKGLVQLLTPGFGNHGGRLFLKHLLFASHWTRKTLEMPHAGRWSAFLGKKAGNYSSVTVTEVNLGTKGLEKDPLEESENTRPSRCQQSQAEGCRLCQGPAGRRHLVWGSWKKFNTAQVLSMSSAKIRPQR